MDESIAQFCKPQRIAVVGVSPTGKGFGYTIFKTLKKRGFEVIPVHPSGDTIDGQNSYKSLNDIPDIPDSAVVVVQPEAAQQVVSDAAQAGIRNIWFQQGADFSRAEAMAREKGLTPVVNRCILMYSEPVTGIHAFHRFLHDLFSRRK